MSPNSKRMGRLLDRVASFDSELADELDDEVRALRRESATFRRRLRATEDALAHLQEAKHGTT